MSASVENSGDFEGSSTSLDVSQISQDTEGGGGLRSRTGVASKTAIAENTYTIRPNFHLKFRPAMVKEVLRTVLYDELSGKEYDSPSAVEWTQRIADTVKQRMRDMELERYKYVVHVIIGEQRGQGINMACRCLWDSDADNVAQETYLGESIFGVAAVFGVFYY